MTREELRDYIEEQRNLNVIPYHVYSTLIDGIDTLEQTRDEKLIDAIDFVIKATGSQDDYCMGMRNGMRYVKSLIDGKEPQYESMWNLGDEVIGDSGTKGVVVGIDIYKGEVRLSLLMKGYKVPQLVKASRYKTKTGRHFPQIIEVLEQIEGDERWKIDLS